MPDRNQRIGGGMDWIAPVYSSLARLFFGNGILKAQCEFIAGLPPVEKALVIGGGSGEMIALSALPDRAGQLWFAELSGKMIARAQGKIFNKNPAQLIYHHGDGFGLDGKFDLIITPFVMDFYGEDEIARKIHWIESHLNENGMWHYSDFRPGLKGARRFIINQLFLGFGIICGIGNREVVDVRPLLNDTGFQVIKEKISTDGWFETLLLKKQTRKESQGDVGSY